MKVLIYSGGMDSTVLLYKCKNEIVETLTFDYGSKHNAQEAKRAYLNSKALNIKNTVIPLDFIKSFFRSDLLKSGGEIPEGHYADLSMKRTVVPFRNAIMLSIATGYAESIGAKSVLIANHFGDHAIYPDCRNTFIESFKEAMAYGTYENIKLESPFVNLTKRDIALIGKELGVDFTNTYSCYKGGEKHCGKCGTCVERKEALEGFDFTEYE